MLPFFYMCYPEVDTLSKLQLEQLLYLTIRTIHLNMTIYVLENDLQVNIAFNQANLAAGDYTFTVTSQYSHQSTIIYPSQLLYSNSRYSMIEVTFPVGFGDEHKNGIYYWKLYGDPYPSPIQEGLVKIITNPGGEINTLAYDSGLVTEERVSDVYFRPNY